MVWLLRLCLDADLFSDLLGILDLILECALLSYEEDAICRVLDLFRARAADLLGYLGGLRLDTAGLDRSCIREELLLDYDYAADDEADDCDCDYDDELSTVLILRSYYRLVGFLGDGVCWLFYGDFSVYRFVLGVLFICAVGV